MKTLYILIAVLLSGALLSAQDIVVSTDVPSIVTVGEQFRITYTVNTRNGSLEAPNFDNFYKLGGPQISTSSQRTLSAGKVTSVVRNSFSYFLQATKEGKFTIEPAKYIVKNKEYFSRPITIEVIKAEQQGAQGNPNNAGAAKNETETTTSTVPSSELYVRLLVNRTKVILGEHIVATLKIYSRVNLTGIQEASFPDFKGFLKTDIETTPLRSLEQENIGGKIFNTGVIQRFLIYPQKTGSIEIEPSELTVLVQEQVRNNNMDPFFSDFFSSYNTVQKVLASMPVNIEVNPLPGNAPTSFSGTVGSISITSTADMDTMKVNDALTYRISLSGKGNLRLSSPPELNLSPDIEVYEPKVIPELKTSLDGTSGKKTFEYVLIPRHHGLYSIPSVEYSYFDTNAEAYRTLKTKEHSFYVAKGIDDETGGQIISGISKGDITYLGKDIRYIYAGKVKLKTSSDLIISRSSFVIVYISVILVFLLIIILRREHLKRNSDIVKVKNRKAAKIASARLKQARIYLRGSQDQEFYSELLKALWGYLSDKLSIPVSEISMEKVTSILQGNNVNQEVLGLLENCIETCEYSRYAPVSGQVSSEDIYKNAESAIKSIENAL